MPSPTGSLDCLSTMLRSGSEIPSRLTYLNHCRTRMILSKAEQMVAHGKTVLNRA